MLNVVLDQVRRRIRQEPFFLIAVVLVNGLAIGGLTTVFSIIDSALLRPPPFPSPERILVFQDPSRPRLAAWSYPFFQEIRDSIRAAEAMGVFRNERVACSLGESTVELTATAASSNLFEILGVFPARGRLFPIEEERSQTFPSIIVSDGLWERLFARSEAAIGAAVVLDGVEHSVVGIMPPDFAFPDSQTDLWLPLSSLGQMLSAAQAKMLHPIARLRAEASASQLQQEVSAVIERLNGRYDRTARHKPDDRPRRLHRQLYLETYGGVGFRPLAIRNAAASMGLMFVAGILTMMGAGLFTANLGLIRCEKKGKAAGIRMALGASRWQVARQSLVEALALSAASGGLGLALTFVSVRFVSTFSPSQIPRLDEVAVHFEVLAFVLCATLLSSLAASMAPMIRTVSANPLRAIGTGNGRTTGSTGLSRRLLAGHLAASVLLLIGSGLLLRTLIGAASLKLDGDAMRMAAMEVALRGEDSARSALRLIDELGRLPGVRSAAAVSYLPHELGPTSSNRFITVEDGGEVYAANAVAASAALGDVLGLRIKSGRFLSEQDSEGALPTAVVDEAAAERFWPGRSPIGRRLKLAWPDQEFPWVTVVGVTESIRDRHIRRNDRLNVDRTSEIYLPLPQFPSSKLWFVMRSERTTEELLESARGEVRKLLPHAPVDSVGTVESLLLEATAPQRFFTVLMTSFAALTAALALLSTFGIARYQADLRRSEVAIRAALGASPGSLSGLLMWGGLRPALIGVAIGTIAAWIFGDALVGVFFEVAQMPVLYVWVPTGFLAAALLASWSASLRASRTDPSETLKEM